MSYNIVKACRCTKSWFNYDAEGLGIYIYICVQCKNHVTYILYIYINNIATDWNLQRCPEKKWNTMELFIMPILACRLRGISECRPNFWSNILSFSPSMHQTTALSYKMHILCRKGHATFSQSRVLSSIRVPEQKHTENNPVWSTYATQIEIYRVLWTPSLQDTPRQVSFFPSKCLLSLSPLIKVGKLPKTSPLIDG